MISTSGKKRTQKTNRVSTCFFISNVQPWLFAMCSTAVSHLLDHCMSARSVLKQLRDYRNCLKHLNKQFLGTYYFHLFQITNSLIVNLTEKKEIIMHHYPKFHPDCPASWKVTWDQEQPWLHPSVAPRISGIHLCTTMFPISFSIN